MLKFKITLFSTILGGVIYLILNRANILDMIDKWFYFLIVAVLFLYGLTGFVHNVVLFNKAMEQLKEEIENGI